MAFWRGPFGEWSGDGSQEPAGHTPPPPPRLLPCHRADGLFLGQLIVFCVVVVVQVPGGDGVLGTEGCGARGRVLAGDCGDGLDV